MREVAVFHKESHNGVALVKLGGNIPHQVIHYLVVLAHAFHSNREPLVIALGILPDEHMLGMPNIRRVSSNVDKGVPLYGGINHIVGIADAAGAGNILETVALKTIPRAFCTSTERTAYLQYYTSCDASCRGLRISGTGPGFVRRHTQWRAYHSPDRR